MSVANVLKLDEYRDRRTNRLARARAYFVRDETRAELFDHLVEVADLTGADRVGAVWIDEYGPGLVHPHVVLDLISDRPRRMFAPEPLHRAWERGIPGTYDQGADGETPLSNVVAIALGSDGARGWFLVAESVGKRPRLDDHDRHRLMFLAGECSALVLHRDLDIGELPVGGGPRFAGWSILRDLEGFEADAARRQSVERRFLVGRLARMLVDEDMAISDARRVEHAGAARSELEGSDLPDTADLLEALDAYAAGDIDRLAESIALLAERAEGVDHVYGALDLYECAFEMSLALADPELAVRVARFSGRALRRRARWHEADSWYELGLAIARSAGMQEMVARSLSGLGLVRRERGNFPAARTLFEEALAVAQDGREMDTLASIYHDLMGLEQLSGDFHTAVRHGWRAVNHYRSEIGRTRCMAGLAGVLRDLGDLDAAEDAYTLVAGATEEQYFRIYAAEGLAYVAALRGDADGYARWTTSSDELGWERGPLSAKAEILFFRGLGLRSLGQFDQARRWLSNAVQYASDNGFSRVLFRAEAALESLDLDDVTEDGSTPAPPEVRDGLRAMRMAMAGG